MEWFNYAIKDELENAGDHVVGNWKLVLHKTEGDTYAGALAAFKTHRSAPHLTLDPDGTVYQHVPFSRAARALEHPVGSVETNRARALQIEIVGWSAKDDTTNAQYATLNRIFLDFHVNFGVTANALLMEPYDPKKPQTVSRLSGTAWLNYTGVLAHMHVPANNHRDCGIIDMSRIFGNVKNIETQTNKLNPLVMYSTPVSFGDKNMKKQDISIPHLGNQGEGWITTDIPFDRFVSVSVRGPAPERDGYGWGVPKVTINNTDGKVLFAFTGGIPGQNLDIVAVWVD